MNMAHPRTAAEQQASVADLDPWPADMPGPSAAVDHPSSQAVLSKSARAGQLYEEYCQRVDAGEAVDPDAFCAQHPGMHSALAKLLRAHVWIVDHPEVIEKAPLRWPEAGEEILGFRLVGELGRGTFAHVYLAAQPALGDRLVAVKVSCGGDAEAWTLGRINHDNIVPVYSVEFDAATRSTVVCMPYLGSATLIDVLDRCSRARPAHARAILEAVADGVPAEARAGGREPVPLLLTGSFVEGVVWIACQLADALQHIHELGIYHCDLKPSNVLMTPEGQPMLLDFNLCEDQHVRGTLPGGTPPYMSPEQLAAVGKEPGTPLPAVDGRSDLFSLGVMLYELLAGKHPFGPLPLKLSEKEVCPLLRTRHQQGPVPLRQWNADVDPALAQLVEDCLAVDPDDRPASAAEVARRLRACLSTKASARASRRRRTWQVVAALLLCLGVGAALISWSPSDPASEEALHWRLGRKRFAEKDYAAALEHFNALLAQLPAGHPDRVTVLLERGQVFQAQGATDDLSFALAIQDYHAVHELRPDGQAQARIAYCLLRCKNKAPDETRFYLNEAIRLGYGRVEVCNNLAYCYVQSNELDKAEPLLGEVIRLEPTMQAAYHNRAMAYWNWALTMTGRFPHGGAPATGAEKRAQATYLYWLRLAQKDMEAALRVGPLNAELCLDAGRLWAKTAVYDPSDAATAVKYLKRAVQLGCDPKLVARDSVLAPLRRKPPVRTLLCELPHFPPGQPLPPTLRVVDPG
jgi:serine/threonine protein kinase